MVYAEFHALAEAMAHLIGAAAFASASFLFDATLQRKFLL
jgi:hypothetical protein